MVINNITADAMPLKAVHISERHYHYRRLECRARNNIILTIRRFEKKADSYVIR